MNSEISLFFLVWFLCSLHKSEGNDAYNGCNFETVLHSSRVNSQHSIYNHPNTQPYFSLTWILIECM